jgi:hypothetical protein
MTAIVSDSPILSKGSVKTLMESEQIVYEGKRDSLGNYHGDGILKVGQVTFEGIFRHGMAVSGKWVIQSRLYRYSGDAKVENKGTNIYPVYHGSGTLKNISTKEVYIGQFQNGKKHGSGILINANETKEGTWLNDEYQPNNASMTNKTTTNRSTKATGIGVGAAPPQNGFGSVTTKNGSTYNGHFINGKRHGQGVYIDTVSSIKYDGDW